MIEKLINEVWKPVVGYEEWYEVSNEGQIRSWHKRGSRVGGRSHVPRILSLREHNAGYWRVHLSKGRGKVEYYVHHIVYEAFNGPIPSPMMIRHLDGDPKNNRPSNLAVGSQLENMQDAVRHGTTTFGERNPMAILTKEDVREIRRLRGQLPQAQIGKLFGVHKATVSDIQLRKRWKHVA